jgi:hypothetical protein
MEMMMSECSKSDECYRGQHDQCDGCNLNSPMGCNCPCHFEDEEEEEET